MAEYQRDGSNPLSGLRWAPSISVRPPTAGDFNESGFNVNMLPKLTANFLSSSRAAASHPQSAPLRNVHLFSPSYPPSPLPPATPFVPNSLLAEATNNSSSSGGRSGDSRGNRFYEGYTGPGRAVTQANFLTSYDGPNPITAEELEELDGQPRSKDTVAANSMLRTFNKHQRQHRLQRRNSMALGFIGPNRIDRAHTFGIFSAVQTHLRDQPTTFIQSGSLTLDEAPIRHADTAAANPTQDSHEPIPTTTALSHAQPSITDVPSALLRPPDSPLKGDSAPSHDALSPKESEELRAWREQLREASSSKDMQAVLSMAEALLISGTHIASDARHADILEALADIRRPGDPITVGLRLYNHLIQSHITPSLQAYRYTIALLCARDEDVRRAIARAESLQRRDPTALSASNDRIALLKAENNFASALALFGTASSNLSYSFDVDLCNTLLTGCAAAKNVDAALRVVAHLNGAAGPTSLPDVHTFSKLIRVYHAVGDLHGAQAVFNEFKAEAAQRPGLVKVEEPSSAFPWHSMMRAYFNAGRPEEALVLLEEMLSMENDPEDQRSIPAPTQLTYSTMITGFCDMGDISSACAWFDRLLTANDAAAQSDEDSDFETMSQSTATSASSLGPLPPNRVAWAALLSALYKHEDLDAFTKYYALLDDRKTKKFIAGWPLPYLAYFVELTQRSIVHFAPSDPQVDKLLRPLADSLSSDSIRDMQKVQPVVAQVMQLLADHGRLRLTISTIRSLQHCPGFTSTGLQSVVASAISKAVELKRTEDLSMSVLLDAVHMSSNYDLDLLQNPEFASELVAAYVREGLESVRVTVTDPEDWKTLAAAFSSIYTARKSDEVVCRMYQSFVTGLGEVLAKSAIPASISSYLATVIGETLAQDNGIFSDEELTAMLQPFGEEVVARYSPHLSVAEALFDSEPEQSPATSLHPSTVPSPTASPSIRIGESITRFLEDFCAPEYNGVQPLESYHRVMNDMERGLFASPLTLSKYIPLLARHGLYEQSKHTYTSSHPILASLSYDPSFQARSWFAMEDGMMTAAATAGDVIASNVHRARIIEQGGAPSAAAYAALIIASKSMTDDATAASTLFAESQALGVKANTYLYNVVISALSRARRAEEALALFGQMKQEGVRWSSVTYGALIGACTRIGDEQTAKQLFDEMLAHSTLKPRVPPFNTMIQMYVQIKPDREQALHYHQLMVRRRIRPTAHTYKLLMDCWGTIEPVNLVEMEKVFRQLEHDRDVTVGGPHFASLINAYGCVAKDLDKAVAAFESIATKPYVLRAPASAIRLPDPICYEAIINVFVSHRRTDLIRQYLERLKVTHVHMTAYVANLVIKGMAQCGDMEGARALFESLEDPPSGLAGHVRHNHGDGEAEMEVPSIDDGPVYREPSTWEAMVRAELGAGERFKAEELLRRMETRFYPELVIQRVRSLVYPIEEFTTGFSMPQYS